MCPTLSIQCPLCHEGFSSAQLYKQHFNLAHSNKDGEKEQHLEEQDDLQLEVTMEEDMDLRMNVNTIYLY